VGITGHDHKKLHQIILPERREENVQVIITIKACILIEMVSNIKAAVAI
jgi:hypothetical protein